MCRQSKKDICFSIQVQNDHIPEKKGIGGSAALCTSLASSLFLLFKEIDDKDAFCVNDEVCFEF